MHQTLNKKASVFLKTSRYSFKGLEYVDIFKAVDLHQVSNQQIITTLKEVT